MQDNKQQHFQKCHSAAFIRQLSTISKLKCVANSFGISILMIMYSHTPSPGHVGSGHSA